MAAIVLSLVGTLVAPARASVRASSSELTAHLDALSADLGRVQADHDQVTASLVGERERVATGRPAYDAGVDAETRAYAKLSRYAVSAYVTGDLIDFDVTVSALTDSSGDLDAQGRRVLTTTAHGELVGQARRATSDVNRLTGELRDAETAYTASQSEQASLAVRRDELVNEIAATRGQIEQARASEAAAAQAEAARRASQEAEDRARAEDDAVRAATPQPESVRSGVVPPGAVRDQIIEKLGGEIPAIALNAYWRAASILDKSKPGCKMDWALIAAIGRVETNHGTYRGTTVSPDGSTHPVILGIPLDGRQGTALIRDTDGGALDGDPIYDRAVGPMQFIPSTWKIFAADGNGDGIADPHNIYDAALAAGNYLCQTAEGPVSVAENASRAVYAYNRSAEYNRQVLTLADHYRRTVNPNLPPPTTPPTVPTDVSKLPPPASPTEPTTTSTTPGATSTTTATTSTTTDPTASSSTSSTTSTTNPPHPPLPAGP